MVGTKMTSAFFEKVSASNAPVNTENLLRISTRLDSGQRNTSGYSRRTSKYQVEEPDLLGMPLRIVVDCVTASATLLPLLICVYCLLV